MTLSEHFELKEFTDSSTAERDGIENSPSAGDIERLQYLVDNLLQPLRDLLVEPIYIRSGYRCLALNEAVGGSSTSQHMRGEAADIKVDGLDAEGLARFILNSGLGFQQLIYYAESRGGHVHISLSRPTRGEVFYAPASGGYKRR